MEDPLKTLVVGMIGGGLMGILFVGHLSLLMVYNPPRVLEKRAVVSKVSGLITFLTLVTFVVWNVLAILFAFVAQATQSGNTPHISLVPSPVYLLGIVFFMLLIAIPSLVFFNDKKMHLGGELILFGAIFGLLIPNLVFVIHQ